MFPFGFPHREVSGDELAFLLIQFLVRIPHFLDLPPFERGSTPLALAEGPRPEPLLGLPFEPDPDEEFGLTVNVLLNPVREDGLGVLCVLCVLSFLRRLERGAPSFSPGSTRQTGTETRCFWSEPRSS